MQTNIKEQPNPQIYSMNTDPATIIIYGYSKKI